MPSWPPLEVAVTCSHSIPQAVARLNVGVIIGCTTMYNVSVSKKGCMRYHWLYEDVCYDVQDRLTWVFDPDSDEKEEAWNYWTIWDDPTRNRTWGSFGSHLRPIQHRSGGRGAHSDRNCVRFSTQRGVRKPVFDVPKNDTKNICFLAFWRPKKWDGENLSHAATCFTSR